MCLTTSVYHKKLATELPISNFILQGKKIEYFIKQKESTKCKIQPEVSKSWTETSRASQADRLPHFLLRGDFGMLGFGLGSGHSEVSRSNQANHPVDLAHVDAL